MNINIKTKVWIWDGPNPWYFVRIPEAESKVIRKEFRAVHRGWGSIPVNVKIGESKWKTSIFWEKKGTYLLPIKKSIRIKENISNTSEVDLNIKIDNVV